MQPTKATEGSKRTGDARTPKTNNSNNLVVMKIKKEDEKSHQRLYQCTHWHPIDAEKRGAYYMCTVELVLFIFSVLDMF